ncbi:MAG: glycoside hydrolase family 3 protein [Defluviitaleaceae bacterium]|nr:glycoside hydrolase family 3 protein [Defluviitaleaceae bacterium]
MRIYYLSVLVVALLVLAACGTVTLDRPVYTAAVYNEAQDAEPEPAVTAVPSYTAAPSTSGQTMENPTPENPTQYPVCEADIWIGELSLREKIGQLIMPRLPWQTTHVSTALHDWFASYPVGGIILFSDNVDTVGQVQALTSDLQAASRFPLFIATDEEGGRVSRVGRLFPDSTILPAYEIGRTNDPEVAYMTGRIIGEGLLSLGINMNFAPVADVWTNPANTVIGNRSFGRDPEVVGLMVDAAVRGLNSAGVVSTIKHFPGHGDTYEDSHYLLAVYPHDRERFDQVEAPPFMRGIEAGAHGVMMGHIATPLLQNSTAPLYWMEPWLASGTLPATFSDFWMQDVLRGEMGFEGLIITDALEMRALSDHFTPEQIAVGAFVAGADILLMPTDIPATFDALIEAYQNGVFDTPRLHESLRRIYWARNNG